MSDEADLKPLPEVRQCVDPDDSMFGAVAVKSAIPGYDWGVMTTNNGGHNASTGSTEAKAVEAWPVLKEPTLTQRRAAVKDAE